MALLDKFYHVRTTYPRPLRVLSYLALFLFFIWLYQNGNPFNRNGKPLSNLWRNQPLNEDESTIEKAFVVASTRHENTIWLREFFSTTTKYVYVVDDSSAPLTVPANKGREAMVYLTCVFLSCCC
jgi:hypothetical protein